MTEPAAEGGVLVLADDSAAAMSAVRVASDVAGALARPLAILGVSRGSAADAPITSAIAEAQAYAQTRVASLEAIQATGEVLEVAQRRVSESPTSLVVIGANFRGGDPRHGVASRVWRIVKALEPPVLVVPAGTAELRRCLFCTGGERFIEEGAGFAARLAAALGAAVTVFHVSPHAPAMYGGRLEREEEDADEFLASNSRVARNVRRQIEIFRGAGVRTEFRVAGGDVVREVVSEIGREAPDLVIVGSSPARGAIRAYVLGDLTREILARARKPFLVLRSRQPGFWAEVWKSLTEGAAAGAARTDAASERAQHEGDA